VKAEDGEYAIGKLGGPLLVKNVLAAGDKYQNNIIIISLWEAVCFKYVLRSVDSKQKPIKPLSVMLLILDTATP